MADHGTAHFTGPETIEELTDDRMRMWSGFTTAIVIGTSAVVILLIGMAFFLL